MKKEFEENKYYWVMWNKDATFEPARYKSGHFCFTDGSKVEAKFIHKAEVLEYSTKEEIFLERTDIIKNRIYLVQIYPNLNFEPAICSGRPHTDKLYFYFPFNNTTIEISDAYRIKTVSYDE